MGVVWGFVEGVVILCGCRCRSFNYNINKFNKVRILVRRVV